MAREDEVEVIVQLGDFGFSFDRNMIESISAWLARDPNHKWYWIDGNHDQHDYLDALVAYGGSANPSRPINMEPFPFEDMYSRNPHKTGYTQFPDRLFYVPRGTVFTIGETNILALGGAYSIDEHYRTPHHSWWEQELITYQDVAYAMDQSDRYGPIDVMITHDAPSSEYLENWLSSFGYKVDPKSGQNRNLVSVVTNHARPQHLYHGHYHERYDTHYDTPDGWRVDVHGVAANLQPARSGHNYVLVDW
jgi:predicted phosphodiesterase